MTILFNSTRKGLNGQLKELSRAQKHKLFRNFAKNFPLTWCEKFGHRDLKEWRMEYIENCHLEKEEFDELWSILMA